MSEVAVEPQIPFGWASGPISFHEGLDVSHQGAPAHTTTIGYSYGSAVVGYADQFGGGLNTDEVVNLGSLGMGTGDVVTGPGGQVLPGIDSADDLRGVDADHVWSGRNLR